MDPSDLPRYTDFILPSIRAVEVLGGSATAREIREHVIEGIDDVDRLLQ